MLEEISIIVSQENRKIWLDAGCGPGTMIDLLLKNQREVYKVYGIDFDGVMLDQATQRMKKRANVEIKHVDLSHKLTFFDSYFDGVIANLVLSYIIIFENRFVGNEALKMALKEMYRVLKNDGTIIWTTPIDNVKFYKVFIASWRELLNPLTPQYIYFGPRILNYANKIQLNGKKGIYHFLSKELLYKLMSEVGFRDVKIKRVFAKQAYLISGVK